MSIGLTPRAKRSLELAEQEALRLGHNYIGTHHILLGLILEDGIAAGLLEHMNVTLEPVRKAVAGITHSGGSDVA